MVSVNLRNLAMVSTSASWRRHWQFLWIRNAQKPREESGKRKEPSTIPEMQKAKQ